MGGYYLRSFAELKWDNPRVPLVMMSGPLVATPSPTSGRFHVNSLSPLTGTITDDSVGGSFGTELKRAGLDGIVITGSSDELCGVEINDDEVKIKNASHLKGMETTPVYDKLKEKGAVGCIGPAAENGVLYSSIMFDRNYLAARGGIGLVAARKNLKYLTVKGSEKIEVSDFKRLKKAREDIFRQIAATPVLFGKHGFVHYGTGSLYDLMSTRRIMPTANYRKTHFDEASDMNAVAFEERYQPDRAGCRGCHILCKRMKSDGRHLPEFETMSHFSALLENEDIEVVAEANTICNEMGFDTISAGATLSCYAEINDVKLTGDEIIELLEKIGNSEGIGEELARGSYRYAESEGYPELSISVKKQELPAYDPRGAYGMALGYVTSTRGGCHLRAYPISHEILRKPVATDRFSFSGKARIVKIEEDLNATVDSLTACKFVFFASGLEEYAEIYSAVTGLECSEQDLMRIGERIYYNEKIMNALRGFTSEDDDLPERFFKEEGSSAHGITIKPIERNEFLKARQKYYKIRGLDENGMPTSKTAEELGLKWNP